MAAQATGHWLSMPLILSLRYLVRAFSGEGQEIKNLRIWHIVRRAFCAGADFPIK